MSPAMSRRQCSLEPKVWALLASLKLPGMSQNSCYPRLRVIFKGKVENIETGLRVTVTPVYPHISTHADPLLLPLSRWALGAWKWKIKLASKDSILPQAGAFHSLGRGGPLGGWLPPGAQSARYLGLEDFSQMEKFYLMACLPSRDFYSHLIIGKFQLWLTEEFEPQWFVPECHTQLWKNRDIFQEVVSLKVSWGKEGKHLASQVIPSHLPSPNAANSTLCQLQLSLFLWIFFVLLLLFIF